MGKIFWKYFILYVVIIGFFAILMGVARNTRLDEHTKADLELVLTSYRWIIDSYKKQSQSLYFNRINRPAVIDIFKQAQTADETEKSALRAALYRELSDMYGQMRGTFVQLQFHLPDNRSFLRFRTPRLYGDDLTGMRPSVEYVNHTHRPIEGFEAGRTLSSFRFVYPLFDGDRYLGSVETSVSMSDIVHTLRQALRVEADFIVKASVVRDKTLEEEQTRYEIFDAVDDYLCVDQVHADASPLIHTLCEDYFREQERNLPKKAAGTPMKHGAHAYMFSLIPLKNSLDDRIAGYLIVAREHKDIDLIHRQFVSIITLLSILLGVIAYMFYALEVKRRILQHHKEIHERIEEIGSLGSWEYDLRNKTLRWSDEVYRIFGETPQSFQASYETFMHYIHPDDREKVADAYQNSLNERRDYHVEHRIVRNDGTVRYVEEDSSHVITHENNVIRSIGTVHDITNLKLFEQELQREKEAYEQLVQSLPEIIYRAECTMERSVHFINRSTLPILGYAAEKFLNNARLSLGSLIVEKDRAAYDERLRKAIAEKEPVEMVYRMMHSDGHTVWVKENIQFSIQENTCFIDALIQDITLQKEAMDKLQRLIDLQENIILVTNGDHAKFANRKLFDFFGVDNLEEFTAQNQCICRRFIPRKHFFHLGKVPEKERWTDTVAKLEKHRRIVIMMDKHGDFYAFSVSVSQFDDNTSIAVFSDISATISERENLRSISEHDKLTGAYNREYLHANFERYAANAFKHSHLLTVILFDIDHFKQINDTYGHNRGDEVLAQLTLLIRQSTRIYDKLIRWGGEEFIVLAEISNPEQATKIAETLRKEIERTTFEEVGTVTCSFGVALHREGESIKQVVARADSALYLAKERGRNRVETNIVEA